ncbi:MAG TPA: HEPN domain-containing protein [Desulfosporosinus sp.]|nr:HEPN domain-containing protein [Desulfosporosinus sp.]
MDDIGFKDLAFYRLESAGERLVVAEDLFRLGHYRDCLSKAYYSVFQSARAVLATKELDSRKHSGVISMFNLYFVKTEIFPKEFRKIIASSQDLRLASDYDDFFLASKQEAEKSIADARKFINGVESFLKTHYLD